MMEGSWSSIATEEEEHHATVGEAQRDDVAMRRMFPWAEGRSGLRQQTRTLWAEPPVYAWDIDGQQAALANVAILPTPITATLGKSAPVHTIEKWGCRCPYHY
jgi:hypothetical protein